MNDHFFVDIDESGDEYISIVEKRRNDRENSVIFRGNLSGELFVSRIGEEILTFSDKAQVKFFDSFSICVVCGGRCCFDGIVLSEGDGFVVSAGCSASLRVEKYESVRLLRCDYGGNQAKRLAGLAGFTRERATFTLENPEILKNLKKTVDSALNSDYSKLNPQLHLDALLLEIFAIITSERLPVFSGSIKSAADRRVERGVEFIGRNYALKNCIALLAKEQGVTQRYLSRLFMDNLSRSPRDILIDTRIEKAKNMLAYTRKPVSAVARSVGYEDSMQFTRLFKKHTGKSPSDYRKLTAESIK